MVSTTGSQLLPQDAVFHLLQNLVPIATVITPNIPEAKLMIQREKDPNPQTQEEIIELAKELHKLGPKYVLVKGGHFQRGEGRNEGGEDKIVDVLYDGKQATLVKKEYLDGKNTHGTGCSLACMRSLPNPLSALTKTISGHCLLYRLRKRSSRCSSQSMSLCRGRNQDVH